MTKDLALLVGADQKWLSTTGFLDKIDAEPEEGDGVVRLRVDRRRARPGPRRLCCRKLRMLGPARTR